MFVVPTIEILALLLLATTMEAESGGSHSVALFGSPRRHHLVEMLQLITILNRCHRFPGFVYQQAGFSSDQKSIEIAVRPRKGSAAVCSRCHQSAPGYDQLPERHVEFIPFWGFLVFLLPCVASIAVVVRRSSWRKCPGAMASAP
jgi:hypothetical protein